MQALFQTPDYKNFTSALLRSRVRVLRELETADEKDFLRAQGQAFMLRVIESMPMQVENDLRRMDEADEREAERREEQRERPGVFSVRN